MPGFGGHTNLDHSVFSQIVRGMHPHISANNISSTSSFKLIKSANSRTIATADTASQLHQLIDAIDPASYGFYTSSDYEIKISIVPGTSKHEAIIVPLKVYDLRENMLLPPAPDTQAQNMLIFFSDEFERVKIRAESVLNHAMSEDAISLYARRNLQLGQRLFHDSRILFRTTCLEAEPQPTKSYVYVIYILNLFIIRALVFYSKYFEPYTNKEPLREENLRAGLLYEVPTVIKYPWLFDQRPNLNEIYQSFIPKLEQVPPAVHKVHDNNRQLDLPQEPPEDVKAIMQLRGAFRLNCNTNTMVDLIYQLMTEKTPEGLPYLEAKPSQIADFLSFFCLDKFGNPISKATVKTILQPSRTDKRPKPGSSDKLNLKDFLKDPE